MAWLPPELEIGDEPELKPPELEPEFTELEPEEPEPVELDPVELDPVELDPVEPELVEPEPVPDEPEPELAEDEFDEDEFDDAELLDVLVLCVEPGRTRASAPAVTTLAMVTAVVVDRTLARPRSRAAWPSRIALSRRVLLMSSSCGHVLVNLCTNLLGQL